jgi:threonylcarbamoyladenosine tRNA methylthiotransferase MtaB
MTRTVAFQSLGCKLNQYEIQALREGFLRHGFSEVSPSEAADYYVLNTCTVTAEADIESRRLIRSYHRKNPEGNIIVTGCYATASPDEVKGLPGVTFVADNRSKNQILFKVTGLPEVSEEESPFFENGISYFEERSKAFVKVQDGCNYFCTFCKIPYVRGRLVSRPEAAILEEVKRLVAHGYEEVVLSGVCLGSYGKDLGNASALTALIEKMIGIEGRFRVKLSSIDPRDTPVEIAELMKGSRKLSSHLHLSLQSGDDKALQRMKRGYTAADYARLVHEIRARVPDIGLTTDVIVGFPGEDEAAFENTRRFLERIRFHKVHLFPYSERPGTKAAGLDEKVPVETIRRREKILKETLAPVTRKYLDAFIGRTLEVLVESTRTKDGRLQGFSENYIRCVFEGDDRLKGTLREVTALRVADEKLICALPATRGL